MEEQSFQLDGYNNEWSKFKVIIQKEYVSCFLLNW